jgi:hypothetical protein
MTKPPRLARTQAHVSIIIKSYSYVGVDVTVSAHEAPSSVIPHADAATPAMTDAVHLYRDRPQRQKAAGPCSHACARAVVNILTSCSHVGADETRPAHEAPSSVIPYADAATTAMTDAAKLHRVSGSNARPSHRQKPAAPCSHASARAVVSIKSYQYVGVDATRSAHEAPPSKILHAAAATPARPTRHTS